MTFLLLGFAATPGFLVLGILIVHYAIANPTIKWNSRVIKYRGKYCVQLRKPFIPWWTCISQTEYKYNTINATYRRYSNVKEFNNYADAVNFAKSITNREHSVAVWNDSEGAKEERTKKSKEPEPTYNLSDVWEHEDCGD